MEKEKIKKESFMLRERTEFFKMFSVMDTILERNKQNTINKKYYTFLNF